MNESPFVFAAAELRSTTFIIAHFFVKMLGFSKVFYELFENIFGQI